MFLNYTLSSGISYSKIEPDNYTSTFAPDSINYYDFSCPVKKVNGPTSGPEAVLCMIESQQFRKGKLRRVSSSSLSSLISLAHEKDLSIENSNSDFSSSDEGYVTLKSFLEIIKQNGLVSGTLKWYNTTNGIKQAIHRYGSVIIETYLANSFLVEQNGTSFDIGSTGSGIIPVKDYTKVFIGYGYDSTGVIVQNTIGDMWGNLGFARISWNCLNGNVSLPDDGGTQKCFIRAAAFQKWSGL